MSKIQSIYIEIISSCNLKCSYCYNHENLSKSEIMTLKDIHNIITFCKINDIYKVIISGGEPLLHKNIDEILYIFKCNDIKTTIISNLTLIDNDFIKILKDTNTSIICSIDTFEKSEKNLLNTIKNLLILSNELEKEKIIISIVIHGQSTEELEKLLSKLLSYDIRNINVPINGSQEFEDIYIENVVTILHKYSNLFMNINSELYTTAINNIIFKPHHYCTANKNVKIDFDLNIYPCPLTTDKSHIIGKFIEGEGWVMFKNSIKKMNNLYYNTKHPDCLTCDNKSICNGSCYFNMFNDNSCFLKIAYKKLGGI